jgi:hypothetical protein
MKQVFILFFLAVTLQISAQSDRWQQRVKYDMEIDFDVKKHRYQGEQKLWYYNNSPDTLHKVFYHLYFNAFQPGSMMDVRSRTIADPDRRIIDRISQLNEDEIGYQKVNKLTMNGTDCEYFVNGTILEVDLPQVIYPGERVLLYMEFEAQVPVQIRRSGRDSREGISYSMSQWYPKLCEYDYQGWHANPYVGREFHGVWGDFDVKIKIDRKYTVAASGLLQEAEKMGHGYSERDTKTRPFLGIKKLRWHFVAENVHDFMWAADPDYEHIIKKTKAGTELHYFYDPQSANVENWLLLHDIMDEAQQFMNKKFGKYPYPVYAFIQGGDGGMEYAMGTLITGNRYLSSLVGVSIHEWMHSWYQMVLGTNESLYPWMDEGFTSYASNEVMNYLRSKALIPGKVVEFPQSKSLRNYAFFSQSGYEEALSTHADHFITNRAYGAGAYTKGNVFLAQLEYIIGKPAFDKALLRYYNEWKFKHPNPNDFIRVFEKVSMIELDWYKEYMVNTTHSIDYAIDSMYQSGKNKSTITLKRIGLIPMPVDVLVQLKNGEQYFYNIPLRIMRGHKTTDIYDFTTLEDWPWTHPEYRMKLDFDIDSIKSVRLDPFMRMADTDLDNNFLDN